MAQFRPIVRSLLETDFYKLTMWQALYNRAPNNIATYSFVCRNTPRIPLATLCQQINQQLDHLCSLKFTTVELNYLQSLGHFSQPFLEYLRNFQLNRQFISVSPLLDGSVSIQAQGPQLSVMQFEIYVLYIVSELHWTAVAHQDPQLYEALLASTLERIDTKINWARENLPLDFSFFDFGLRRRASSQVHQHLISKASELPQFKGTSNVYEALLRNLPPIGTMAHEYLQTYQAMPGVPLPSFQHHALSDWLNTFHGNLAVALTDVISMDAFLKTLTPDLARAYTGLRHDSGDPHVWAQKALNHYIKLGINPLDKKLIFSDGLTFSSALDIHHRWHHKIPCAFGIGTWLTNDSPVGALNLVMKVVSVNNQPVAKISDAPGKTICTDQTFIQYLTQACS